MLSRFFRPSEGWKNAALNVRVIRVFRYADFRLLWFGAFVSFTGSWIQQVAQGHFVYELTHSESRLAMLSFIGNMPVLFFGLVAGSFADRFNKRTVLIWTQLLFGLAAIYLAVATYYGFVSYIQIVIIALINGMVGSIEMPTRQSVVSRVVPPEELAAAVPVNAMTFNAARIIGPAIGGLILSKLGVSWCYLLNGLSFLALIWSAIAIKSNLRSTYVGDAKIMDLVREGARYTFRKRRLRVLFLLETTTAVFGLAYIPLMPAYVSETMHAHDPKQALGLAYSFVGVGAMLALIVVSQLADSRHKGKIIQLSMAAIGTGLILLSLFPVPAVAYPVMAIIGMGVLAQLNTTNALFQTLSPDRLRGRVLAMHIWSLNGLSPFGILFFGWLANETKITRPDWLPMGGVALAFQLGGILTLIGAFAALLNRRTLSNLA